MKFKNLTLQNFRKFESQTFCFHPQFNVVIGRNATGKTQLLDALAIILDVYQTKIFNRERVSRGILEEEVRLEEHRYGTEPHFQYNREARYPVSLTANICYQSQLFKQVCSKKTAKGRTTFGRPSPFAKAATEDWLELQKGSAITLPFLGYYGAGRLQPLSRHAKQDDKIKMTPESRTKGYENSLDPRNDVVAIKDWFKRREFLQWREDKGDIPLELVSEAARKMIPGCNRVYFDKKRDEAYLEFADQTSTCPFGNLSDGFRSVVAMATDIARRIAILNPHLGLEALEKTSGVVLIDELDLYLHPEWQRHIVGDLKNTFPALQFIVTTHSPFIIQAAQKDEALDLERCDNKAVADRANLFYDPKTIVGEGVAFPGPAAPYANRSIEDIVEDIMGVPQPQRSARLQEMYDVAKEYYLLLEQGEKAGAEEKERIKNQLDEMTARFSDDVAYYAFLEMERKGAGLGSSRQL